MNALFNAISCYVILKGVLLPNTWASQQHKYLKHDGREPVASETTALGRVLPNLTGQVFNFEILRIFRWKLWVTLCSASLSKWSQDTKRMWIGIPILLPRRFHEVPSLRKYVAWFWLPHRGSFVDTSNF